MSGKEGTIAVCRKVSQVAAGLEICCEDERILEECWALQKVSSCENLLQLDKHLHMNKITLPHNNALCSLCVLNIQMLWFDCLHACGIIII